MTASVQGSICAAVMLVAIFVFVIMLIRTKKRLPAGDSAIGNLRRDELEAGGVRRELERLMVDIETMCREVTARLDTKIRVLNELIMEADGKIAQLKRVSAKSAPEKPADSPAAKAEESAPPEKPPETQTESIESDPRFKRIFEMADAGADLVAISRETGTPKGEIKLILDLRNRRQ